MGQRLIIAVGIGGIVVGVVGAWLVMKLRNGFHFNSLEAMLEEQRILDEAVKKITKDSFEKDAKDMTRDELLDAINRRNSN